MLPSLRKEAQSNLRKQLVDSTRNLKESLLMVPRIVAAFTPLEVYNRFLIVAPDVKGNASYAFGAHGIKVGVSGTVKFPIALPLISLKSSLNITVTSIKDSLIIIHRPCPRRLANPEGRLTWKTNNPVTFMTLKGYQIGLDVGLSATIGGGEAISFPFGDLSSSPIISDLVGTNEEGGPAVPINVISFGIGASASLSGSIVVTVEIYRWSDDHPGFYSSGMDKNLTTDFRRSLKTESVDVAARDVRIWLDFLKEHIWKVVYEKYLDLGLNLPSGFETAYYWLKRFRKTRPEDTDDIQAALDILFLSDTNHTLTMVIPRIDARFLPRLRNAEGEFDAAEAQEQLLNAANAIKNRLVAAKQNIGREADNFPPKNSTSALDVYKKRELCFVNLLMVKPEGEGSGQAFAGAAAVLSVFRSDGVTAKANIGVRMHFRKVFLTYQTYSLGLGWVPLMLTQHTNISYKQVILPGSASLDLKLATKSKSFRTAGESVLYNSMRYYTSSAYWIHPGAGDQEVSLQEGSGFSFGYSMNFVLLVQLIKKLLEANAASTNLDDKARLEMNECAKKLRIPVADFQAFILSLFDAKDQAYLMANDEKTIKNEFYPQLTDYDAILIESSLKIKPGPGRGIPMRVNYRDPLKESSLGSSGIEKIFEEGAAKTLLADNFEATPERLDSLNLQPDAIRLRLRLADNLSAAPPDIEISNPKPSFFKLGFIASIKLVNPFSFDKVNKAGNEGILDFHTYFIPDGSTRTHMERVERSVPPVNLIPHSF
jgi:hypothetical protein